MEDKNKTKEQLIQELEEMRQQIGYAALSEVERKQTQNELKENYEYLEKLNNSLEEAIFTVKLPDRVIEYVNQSVRTIFGYKPGDCIGKTTSFLYPDEEGYLDFGNKLTTAIEEGKEALHTECLLKRKGGEVFPVEITSTLFKEKGKTHRFISIVRDITKRQQAEAELSKHREHLEELVKERTDKLETANKQLQQEITERKRMEEVAQETERRYRLVAENAADAIWTLDMNMRPTYISPSITRLLGYSVEEAMAQTMEEIFTPASFEVAMKAFAEEVAIEKMEQKDLSRSRVLDFELKRKDGSIVPVEVRYSFLRGADSQPFGILAIARDITERKQMEEALRESQEHFRALAEDSSDIIQIVDSEGFICYVSPSVQRILGYKPEELIGRQSVDVVHPDDLPEVAKGFEKAIQEPNVPVVVECRCRHKDGTWRVIEGRGINRLDNPLVKGFISNMHDITERKQMEEALQESEERYRAFFKTSRDCVFITTKDGRWVDFNDDAVEFFGYKNSDELRKVGITALYERPEERERITQTIEQQGFVRGVAVNFRRKDGSIINCLLTAVARTDENGNIIGYQGTIKDITEQKQIEEALGKAEKERTVILDSMSEIVIYQDMENRVIWANRAASESVSLAPEQFVGRYCYEIWHQRSELCVGCPVVKAREIGQPQASEMTTPDGRVWSVRGYPVRDVNGDITGIVESTLEITERKQAEEEIRKSKAQLQAILDGSPDGIRQVDTDLKIIWANQATLHRNPDALGQTCYEALGNRDKPCKDCPSVRAMKTGEIERGVTYQPASRGVSGECYWEGTGVPLKDTEGKIIGAIQITRDITERKQAEEAIKKEKERAEEYLNIAGVMLAILDADEKISRINKKGCEILDYQEGEIIGKNWFDILVPQRMRGEIRGVFGKLMAGDIKPVEYYENPLLTKSGEERTIAFHNTVIRGPDGQVVGVLLSGEDITERKQLEEKTREIEALKELDQMRTELLANVSHELRTPLATIKGYATMLLGYDTRLKRDEKRSYLEFIDKASDRLVGLIDQLLDMSRLESGAIEIDKAPAAISRLIREVVAEAEVRKPGRRLVFNTPKRLPRLYIDAKRIQQVLENIIDNAIKYSEEETEVVISAGLVKQELLISVTDQGIGIPAGDLPKVFDRIYRTRQRKVMEVGGAGLGLSICRKLVEAHGGRIRIESEEGKGTTCYFTLPLATEEDRRGNEA